jgi:hypothetical protein
MPTKRRGGFRPPELRGTLGTLLRTTTGVVRDALERGAREGRARLDDARASRRRTDALADLGEIVLDLIRRGEIDLAELPEARDLVRLLDDLDAEPDDPPPEPRRVSTRSRFDDRPPSRSSASTDPDPDAPPRRRPDPDAAASRRSDRDAPASRRSDPDAAASRRASSSRRPDPDDDGTVSSGLADRTMRPTVPARPRNDSSPTTRAPTKPIKGIWRPQVDEYPAVPDRPDPSASTSAPKRPPPPPNPHRKGGITFDDDDLADYMHPDDVPPKPSDPSDGDP